MQILETISGQARAMRLPLYAVTVTAAARVDTPVLLILHWHGFRRATPVAVPHAPIAPRAVPGSAMQIDARWDSFGELESAMLDAAWQLGAWDVERITRRPWWRLGAPAAEALACRRAFGDYPDAPAGETPVLVEAPDREALMALAARKGYVRWLFRPRQAGLWRDLHDDDATLDRGDGRAPPCPVAPHDFGRVPGRMVYRLGRGTRLIFPDT